MLVCGLVRDSEGRFLPRLVPGFLPLGRGRLEERSLLAFFFGAYNLRHLRQDLAAKFLVLFEADGGSDPREERPAKVGVR